MTDRLDAALLARFAEVIRPAPAAVVPDDGRHPDAMPTRRNQLIGMGVMEPTRLDRLADKAVAAEVKRYGAWPTKANAQADAALTVAVKAGPVWRAKDARLQRSQASARLPRPLTLRPAGARHDDRWAAFVTLPFNFAALKLFSLTNRPVPF